MKVKSYRDLYNATYEDYQQGEIVMLRVPIANPNGVTQGIHPGVIISNDMANKCAPCVTVALITSKVKRLDMCSHMEVLLERSSMVMIEQTVTISKEDILERVAILNRAKMQELKRCMKLFFAL